MREAYSLLNGTDTVPLETATAYVESSIPNLRQYLYEVPVTEKRLEELRRLAEINAVEQEIADIGEVTEEKKEQIQNIREKYEALSEEEKGMVSNSDIPVSYTHLTLPTTSRV